MGNMSRRFEILIAEDDPDDQMIIQEALNIAIPAADLIVVNNGKEAIRFLENADKLPDLLMTDIQMPQMTGLLAVAHIRTIPALAHLPVVILSTSKEVDDIQKSKDLGAVLYISKPLRFTDWVSELQQVAQYLS